MAGLTLCPAGVAGSASCRWRCSWSRRRSSSTGGAPSPPPSAAPVRSTSRSTPAASRPSARSSSRPTTKSCAARPGSSRHPTRSPREEFRRYVGAAHAGKAYDELQATAFFLRVPPGGLAAHERSVREEGFPDYHVARRVRIRHDRGWPVGAFAGTGGRARWDEPLPSRAEPRRGRRWSWRRRPAGPGGDDEAGHPRPGDRDRRPARRNNSLPGLRGRKGPRRRGSTPGSADGLDRHLAPHEPPHAGT